MTSNAQKNLDKMELKVEVSLFFGPSLTSFGQEYRNKEKYLLLKSDIETDDFMVAVSLAENGLEETMRRYNWINTNVHKGRKQVVLIAPNYTDQESILSFKNELDIQVIKDTSEISL